MTYYELLDTTFLEDRLFSDDEIDAFASDGLHEYIEERKINEEQIEIGKLLDRTAFLSKLYFTEMLSFNKESRQYLNNALKANYMLCLKVSIVIYIDDELNKGI